MPATMFGSQQNTPEKKYQTDCWLKIIPINKGMVYAQYINYFVQLPDDIVDAEEAKYLKKIEPNFIEFYGENTYRDVVGVDAGLHPKYGSSRFDPILPGLYGRSNSLKLANNTVLDEREIIWSVHADNAPPITGSIKINEIAIIEKSEKDAESELI
jgi:hypothetical protein